MKRRWVVRVAAGLVATVGLAAAVEVYSWYATRSAGEARLAAVIVRLDESDPGWRLEPLLAARNAALPPAGVNGAEVN